MCIIFRNCACHTIINVYFIYLIHLFYLNWSRQTEIFIARYININYMYLLMLAWILLLICADRKMEYQSDNEVSSKDLFLFCR